MKARIEFSDDDAVGGFAVVETRDIAISRAESVAVFLMDVIASSGYTIDAVATVLICDLVRDEMLSDKQIAKIREAISE